MDRGTPGGRGRRVVRTGLRRGVPLLFSLLLVVALLPGASSATSVPGRSALPVAGPLSQTGIVLGNLPSAGLSPIANNNTVTSGSVATVDFGTPLFLFVNWSCAAPTSVSEVIFRLSLFNVVLYTDTGILSSSAGPVPCAAGAAGAWKSNASLTNYDYILSGTFDGSVTVYDGGGNAISNTTFHVRVVPPFSGLTVLTVPLILLGIYEAYAAGADLVRARRYLRQSRPRSPGGTP